MTNKTIGIYRNSNFNKHELLAANAQEQTIADTTEGSAAKVEKKETVKNKHQRMIRGQVFYVGLDLVDIQMVERMPKLRLLTSRPVVALRIQPFLQSIRRKQKSQFKWFQWWCNRRLQLSKDKFFYWAEVDFSSQRLSKNATSTVAYPCCALRRRFTVSQTVKSDWMMTVHITHRRCFEQGTCLCNGGLAMANIKYDGRFTDTFGQKPKYQKDENRMDRCRNGI